VEHLFARATPAGFKKGKRLAEKGVSKRNSRGEEQLQIDLRRERLHHAPSANTCGSDSSIPHSDLRSAGKLTAEIQNPPRKKDSARPA